MTKSLAESYLDGDIEVEEYTSRVIEDAKHLADIDFERRVRMIEAEAGSSALGQSIIMPEVSPGTE